MARPQVKIEDYEYGKVVIDSQAYNHDVIICSFREQVRPWQLSKAGKMTRKDVQALLDEKPEALIIGLGAGPKLALTRKAIACLEEAGIEWHALPTKKACRAFNKLREAKRVVAAMHITS